MEKNLIKKFYKTNGYFIYRINKKEIINLRYEKYRYLNSFLDRVLNKNYEYFPPFNLIKKDKIIYKL